MGADSTDPVRIDCGGVPLFWVGAAAPYRVALQFRVGRADEPLPAAGVTHLCEHLALSAFQGVSHPFNGRVDLTRTIFFCQGSAEQARHFLAESCRRLSQLPVDHLDREKHILRAEAAGRQRGVGDAMLLRRFGARHYGLGWFPEFGMWTLDGDAVRSWAARWFTRDNAAAWVVGPEPLDLELPLPAGTRAPPPMPLALPLTLPAFMRLASRIVGVGAVVPRSPAAMLTVGVLTRTLQRTLRFEMGAAYNVGSFYLPLTANAAWASVMSELSDTRPEEAARRFLAVLKETAAQVVEEDCEQHRAACIASFDAHGWEPGMADSAAFSELLGAGQPTKAALINEYRSVSLDQIRALADEMLSGALYQVPPGLDVPSDGMHPLPEWSTWVAEGASFEPAAFLPGVRERFVVGERGLTVWVGDKARSVAWTQVRAMLCWADGGRQVLGEDGVQINVVPLRVQRGQDLVAAIDAHVPAKLRVPHGKRICAPIVPPIRRDPAVRRRWLRHLRIIRLTGTVLAIAAVMLLLDFVREGSAGVGPTRDSLIGAMGLFAVAGAAAGVILTVSALTRRAEMSVGGGDSVEVYDVAAAHRQRLPAGVPVNHSHARGGHLLAFLMLHDFASQWFMAEAGDAVDRLRRREITGPELYKAWDGVLASDMLSPMGNEFLFDLLRARSGRRSRYTRLLREIDGDGYRLEPTWDAYDRLTPWLEEELSRWRRYRGLKPFVRGMQAPPAF
jgi:zinc protease